MSAIDDEAAVIDESGGTSASSSTEDAEASRRGDTAETAPPRWAGLVRLKSLWIQAGVLLIVLLALVPLLDNGHIAVPDEGVYLAQAENLSNGSWSRERPAVDVDPEGYFTAVTDNGVVGDRVIAYYKHALYPLALTPAYALAGTTGALTLSVFGTWGAALTAAFLARRLRPGYGPWVLWLVGLGSPLLFDAYISVAHSVAAAFAGLTLLGLSRAVDDRRAVHLVYALPAVALVVALRGEGLILAAATGGVIGLVAIGWPPLRRIDWQAGVIGASVLVVAGVTHLADRTVARAIAGPGATGSDLARLGNESVSPIDGAWASLLRPFTGSWVNAEVWVPLVVLGIVLAALALRLMPRRILAPLALLIGGTAASVGIWFSAPGLVTGLVAAFPLLPAGLLWVRASDLRAPLVARLLAVSVVTAAVVIAANYAVGGAVEWGGRFFHGLIPLLSPLVVLGLDHARRKLSTIEARIALACLIAMTASLSVLSLRVVHDLRSGFAASVTSSVDFAKRHDTDLIVLSKMYADGSGRRFWNVDGHDVLTSYDLRLLHYVLRGADNAGLDTMAVLTDINPMVFALTLQGALDELGWQVGDAEPTSDRSGVLLILEAKD